MKLGVLSSDEVVADYDGVSRLYPHIPPGSMRFFQLVWPRVRDVVGVDVDGGVIESARRGLSLFLDHLWHVPR
ncbi:MAG: hypothetical protein ACRDV9_00775, partial [Acidimicrobiia bacterium]